MNSIIHGHLHFSKCSFQWMAFQPNRVKFCLQKVTSSWEKRYRQVVVVHSNTKRDDAFGSKGGKFTIYFTIDLAALVQRVDGKYIHYSSCN